MKREIIEMEVSANSRTAEIVHPPGLLARILAALLVAAIAIVIFSVVLVVGLSMIVLVGLTIAIAVAGIIVRSFFIRPPRLRRSLPPRKS